MALSAVTIADSIAGLSVTGVTLRDLDQIPESVTPRQCPIVYPSPTGFLSGLVVERDSFGAAASAKKTAQYTLSYVFLHAPVGEGRGLFDLYQGMVTKALAFVDAVIANDALTGAIDIVPADVIEFGAVADPSGKLHHGAVIVFRVTEFIN